MDIEIKNKRNIEERIISAILEGKNVIYNGKYVVNHIGATTYIDFDFLRSLTIEQIEKIISVF